MRGVRPRPLLGLLAALVGGFAVGTVGTFKYRFGLADGAPLLPIGLVVALVAVALVLLALRVLLESRAFAIAAAVGVVAAVVLYSFMGPGGSVVIVEDLYGHVWTFGPAVIAVIVLAVPRIRRRPLGGSPAAGEDDGILGSPTPAGREKERDPQ